MQGDPRPIGVFDSGVGGFSVLAEIRLQLPDEPVVYVADQRFAPYGERTLAEVADRSVQIAGQLIEAGAKVVVVACNSASAAALYRLREEFPDTPFVGMEPAVKPAALHSRTGVVGVLATAATFQGELFASVVDRHANGLDVVPLVGTGLAGLVEAGGASSPEAKELLDGILAPALDAGMDTLVLGCTHYPFLRDAITAVAGEGLTILDPSAAVARQVGRVLDAASLRAPHTGADPSLRLATTGDPRELAAQAADLLDLDDPEIARW